MRSHKYSKVFFLKIIILLLATLTFSTSEAGSKAQSERLGMRNSCVIIDNDFDIDDMMAIPLVIGSKHVAAIIQSEGYTLPGEGAAAVNELVNFTKGQHNQRKIPIIVGGSQAENPNLMRWPWLPFFRSMMNVSNGLIAAPEAAWPANLDYPEKVSDAVANCKKVSILIIGTYTSFINYSQLIKDKIDKVVIMGQQIGDESRTRGRESFNCNFDLNACKLAMDQLSQLNAFFVDIPRFEDCHNKNPDLEYCYTPSLDMVIGKLVNDRRFKGGLKQRGLTGQLYNALINNIECSGFYTTKVTVGRPCTSLSTWEPAAVAKGPGGEMLLWDQTAALFMVNPKDFSLYYPPADPSLGGKHYEPILVNGSHEQTVLKLRKNWTKYTNRAVAIK
jgi:Inosine-uridine preferring nucleoside hydrolase